jgi:nitrogen fixation protein FixH
VVAIIACVGFVIFCSHHPADLVAADYYEQELKYQGQIDGLRQAQSSKEAATVRYDGARNAIMVSLPPEQSQGIASGSIQLYRPSAGDLDRRLNLELDRNGVQLLDASTLAPGLWKVRVSWEAGDKRYFLDEKVIVNSKS